MNGQKKSMDGCIFELLINLLGNLINVTASNILNKINKIFVMTLRLTIQDAQLLASSDIGSKMENYVMVKVLDDPSGER